jgi:two-component system sensor histidine kinase HydH
VTIRKTLLRAFLLVGLAPAILLAVLTFVKARAAMQAEIEHSLTAQAEAIAADVNKVMFERLQNAATWSTLEVMQDLQVQDLDKRLSNFLAKLQSGYGGVYRALYALDRDGVVVSSSDAATLGRRQSAGVVWQRTVLAGATLTLEHPSGDGPDAVLTIRAPIQFAFRDESLGQLVLAFDWGQIDALLDNAGGARMVALVDDAGRVYAASRSLRARALPAGAALAGWHLQGRPSGAFEQHGAPVGDADVMVGLGRARGFAGFAGLGLSAVVIQPQSIALAPVHRMAEISLAILLVLVLVTLALATRISNTIARPIIALTALTRRYKLEQDPLVAPPAASGEVGELGQAFVQMVRDIEQSQSNLVRASKLALVGEMASVIIHEVRTPLGILRSSAQMLKRESGISPEGRELMGFIDSETARLNRLVSAMLDSARARPLHKVRTDMHALVRHTRALLGAQIDLKGIRLSEDFAAKDPMLDCDGEQLTQVLLNLIHNALQILPAGGRIALTTRDDGAQFFIEICDDGPGIPADQRLRIFEAFFFRREGGVGLGLAIVQQIVIAHGGEIEAGEGALGGARFTLRLPRPTQRHMDGQ